MKIMSEMYKYMQFQTSGVNISILSGTRDNQGTSNYTVNFFVTFPKTEDLKRLIPENHSRIYLVLSFLHGLINPNQRINRNYHATEIPRSIGTRVH